MELELTLDDEARVRSVALDRWGAPEREGFVRFVHQLPLLDLRRSHDPSAGHGGWFTGTDRWTDAEFSRYEITGYEPVR